MQIPEQTLQAIVDGINADGGATFRKWMGKVLPHMTDAYRSTKEGHRGHLGASGIGKDCARALWYDFRWIGEDEREATADETGEENSARMLRLWNRGHLEEGRFIALLLMIGARVVQQDTNGKQLRFKDCYGHYAGSMDGIVMGLPEQEELERWLAEFKTYNDKRFTELQKNGVEVQDEHYYVQMQQYMGKFGLPAGLFMAVNKNTDALYAEVVWFNKEVYERYRDRAPKIIFADAPPQKLRGASAGYFKCKMCNYKKACHLGRPVAKNCRTCAFSVPAKETDANGQGVWRCRKFNNQALTLDAQAAGCDQHIPVPGL